jgi:aldehyde:ferredoxin oxidoreductase
MGAHSALQENRLAFLNSLGICIFLVATDPVSFPAEVFAQAVKAVAGLDMIGKDFDMAGERIVNLEKAFNSRMGLRRKDDLLCERWMKEPIVDGPGKGWKGEDYLETSKDEYYEWHGWDKETGLQTRKKLEELDMKDVADVLEGENALG